VIGEKAIMFVYWTKTGYGM